MKQEATITLRSVVRSGGEEDVMELVTSGTYAEKNGKYYLIYEESEGSGYAGCTVTVKAEPGCAAILRGGPAKSQLIVQQGVRHQCCYQTGYGQVTLGVTGQLVACRLRENGGSLELAYTLDLNTSLISSRQVFFSVHCGEN